MTGIDEEEVRRIARLARLELDDDEVGRLVEELGRILDHFDELRELDPDEASTPGHERGSLRPDVPSSDRMTAGPERMAPDWRDGYFVVPRLPDMRGPEGQGP